MYSDIPILFFFYPENLFFCLKIPLIVFYLVLVSLSYQSG